MNDPSKEAMANAFRLDDTNFTVAQLALSDFNDALQEFTTIEEKIREHDGEDDTIVDSPLRRATYSLITNLIDQKASGLQLYWQNKGMQSWFCIDGKQREHITFPAHLYAILRRLKYMAELSPEQVIPQCGVAPIKYNSKNYNLLVECTPTAHGERLNAKLYDLQAQKAPLTRLGMPGEVQEDVQDALRDGGLFLIVGPPGSGKTTTAFTLLHRLKTEQHTVATIEAHPTYTDNDFIQTYRNRRYAFNTLTRDYLSQPKGKTSARDIVASLMRQGVNVLFCGDLTDAETVGVALTAAERGIVTVACVNAPGPAAALSYLRDAGADANRLASALSGILFQLLVGKACPNCEEEAPLDARRQRLLEKVFPTRGNDSTGATAALLSLITPRRNYGCDTCYQTGVLGRTGLFLHEPLTGEVRRSLCSNDAGALAQTDWAKAQMRRFESVVWDAFTEKGISLEELHAVVRPVVAAARRVV